MAQPPELPFLRNSERNDFKRCILRWNWRYNEHLVPISVTHGPLLFGTLGHLALAEYYKYPGFKRGPHPAETWSQITKELMDAVKTESGFNEEAEAEWIDARLLGHSMLINYVNEYGTDPQWEVLAVEDQFHQTIPHPWYPTATVNGTVHNVKNKAFVHAVGTIDLIVRNHETGKVEYVDHKFMKAIETDHLFIDTQNGGYLALGTVELRQRGILKPEESVRVLTYNFLRKAKKDERPQDDQGYYLNQDGTRSKRQPPPYFIRERIERTKAERNQEIRQMGEDVLHMQAVRRGLLPITKSPTKDCKWDCSFFDMCNVHSNGDPDEVEFMMDAMFRREDPYGEYKKGAASPKTLQEKIDHREKAQ